MLLIRNGVLERFNEDDVIIPKNKIEKPEKKVAIFFANDFDEEKSLFYDFNDDMKVRISNKHTIADELLSNNIKIIKDVINRNDTSEIRSMSGQDYSSFIYKKQIKLEIEQALYSVIEAFIRPLLLNDITTSTILNQIELYYGALNIGLDSNLIYITNRITMELSNDIERSLRIIIYNYNINDARHFLYGDDNEDESKNDGILDNMFHAILEDLKKAMTMLRISIFGTLTKYYNDIIESKKLQNIINDKHKMISKNRYDIEDCEI